MPLTQRYLPPQGVFSADPNAFSSNEPKISVPDHAYHIVQLPCHVATNERVFDILGGENVLKLAFSKYEHPRVIAQLRPDDTSARGILGLVTVKSQPRLLIRQIQRRKRITHRDGTTSFISTTPRYEVLGYQHSYLAFDNSLCDYQYKPRHTYNGYAQNVSVFDELTHLTPRSDAISDIITIPSATQSHSDFIMPNFVPDTLKEDVKSMVKGLLTPTNPSVTTLSSPEFISLVQPIDWRRLQAESTLMETDIIPEVLSAYSRPQVHLWSKVQSGAACSAVSDGVSTRDDVDIDSHDEMPLRPQRNAVPWRIEPDAPEVPSGLSGESCDLLSIYDRSLLRTLLILFAIRPCWIIRDIRVILAAHGYDFVQAIQKRIMPHVAYSFVSGPYRFLWIRYGYDPRKDPASVYFQTVESRVKQLMSLKPISRLTSQISTDYMHLNMKLPLLEPLLLGREEGTTNTDNRHATLSQWRLSKMNGKLLVPQFSFAIHGRNQQLSQSLSHPSCIIDMTGPAMVKPPRDTLREDGLLPEYDAHFGWLSEAFTNQVRNDMKASYIRIAQSVLKNGYSELMNPLTTAIVAIDMECQLFWSTTKVLDRDALIREAETQSLDRYLSPQSRKSRGAEIVLPQTAEAIINTDAVPLVIGTSHTVTSGDCAVEE